MIVQKLVKKWFNGVAGDKQIAPQTKRNVFDLNLNGAFYVAQQAARRMLAGNSGVIHQHGLDE